MESQEMIAQSQICKIVEKYKYWKEFNPNMHRFVKMMTGDFTNQLKIPQKFSINFRENLSGTFHLRGPSGFMWAVELERRFDDVFFGGKGWQSFVKDHSLADGDFLYFSYNDNSTFNVVILELTGCEREGSYFVKKHTDACSNGRCVLQKEDAEDSEEVNRVHEKHRQKEKLNKGKRNPSSKAVDSFQLKAPQKRQLKAGKSVSASESSRSAMESSTEDWSTKSERCKLARRYKSGRPWFGIVMKPTHVYKTFRMGIPRQWLKVHVPDKVAIAELRVPPGEKEWPVKIARTNRRVDFAKGWSSFVLDNNLEEHDVCVFEINDKVKTHEESIGINVTIFRVLDEYCPLD